MADRTVLLDGTPVSVGNLEIHRVFWDLVDAGQWEPATLEALSRLAHGVYIDIGAWIGPTVMAAARTASAVIAYEPDPVAAAELRHNILLNQFTNIEVHELALLDRDSPMFLGPGTRNEFGLSVSSLVYGARTQAVSVRDARRETTSDAFSRCSLLKVDVEGAEYKVIGRLAPYLKRKQPTLLLSVHGVHWRNRSRKAPSAIRGPYRRLRSVVERVPLVWRLRHYPNWYLEVNDTWHPISRLQQWALVLRMGEDQLLVSCRPYPSESPEKTA